MDLIAEDKMMDVSEQTNATVDVCETGGDIGTCENVQERFGGCNNQDCITMKYFKQGKDCFIKVRTGVAVYDPRSKRRIGKEEGKYNIIKVFRFDRVVMKGFVYLLENFDTEENRIILKKIKPVE